MLATYIKTNGYTHYHAHVGTCRNVGPTLEDKLVEVQEQVASEQLHTVCVCVFNSSLAGNSQVGFV